MSLWMLITGIFLAVVLLFLVNGWSSFGKAASAERKTAIEASTLYSKGKFRNKLPLTNNLWGSIRDGMTAGKHQKPADTVALEPNDGRAYQTAPESGLRITWLGHSTLLLELDDATFLIDPVWGERISPFAWFGPKRWYAPPLSMENLPEINAVIISHDHYDHLDKHSIEALKDKSQKFIVPLGVGSHLEYWGVAPDKIIELQWWENTQIENVEVTATPARHASGRHLLDLDKTLWAGYAFKGNRSVFYSGDTGLFPGFKEIGERLGPFDLTMIEVGAYNKHWPDWHLGPEQAVIAHEWVGGARLLPLHWGLFDLAMHNWTEPMERVLAASERANLNVVTPRPGQVFEPGVTETGRWWPDLPWQRPQQHAVLSNGLEGLTSRELGLIKGTDTP